MIDHWLEFANELVFICIFNNFAKKPINSPLWLEILAGQQGVTHSSAQVFSSGRTTFFCENQEVSLAPR